MVEMAADTYQVHLQPSRQPLTCRGPCGFWLLGSLGVRSPQLSGDLEAGMQPWRPPALQKAGESQLLCQAWAQWGSGQDWGMKGRDTGLAAHLGVI